MSKLAIFCNNFFIDENENPILNEEEIQDLFHYYLVENFFPKVDKKNTNIEFVPDKIVSKDETLIKPEKWNEYNALFILAELDWNFHSSIDAYGLKLIRLLRLADVTTPIFCYSFFNSNFIFDIPTSTILKTVGHYFISLPYVLNSQNQHLDIKRLSREDLYVCQQLYCRKKGLVSELTHSLESDISGSGDKRKKAVSIIEKLISLQGKNNKEKITEFNSKFPTVTNKNLKEARNFIESYGNEIISDLEEEDDSDIKLYPVADYEILWLDDEIDEENEIYKRLNEYEKISKVHLAKTVDRALEIISEDNKKSRPEIMIAIVDYKLTFKDNEGKEKYRSKQGYEFIKTIAESNILIKLLAYSSMPRNLQLWLSETYGINVTSIPKKAVDISTPNGRNYIVEEIIRLGNENWNRLNNLPNTRGWQNLKSSYIQIVTHPDYETFEHKIATKANEWIEKFLNNQSNEPINISTSGFKPITQKVIVKNDIDLIFRHLKNAFKDFTSYPEAYDDDSLTESEYKVIRNSTEAINYAWKMLKNNSNKFLEKEENQILQAKNLSKENIDHAINYFVARRISIWLKNYNKTYKNHHIASLIRKKEITEGSAKQFMNSLGLRLSKFPNHLTIEEINWCQKDQYEYFTGQYNFIEDVEANKSALNDVINVASKAITQFFKEHDIECRFTVQYNKTNFEFNLSKKLDIKSIDEIKAILNYINSTIYINPKNNQEIVEQLSDYKKKLSDFVKLLLDIKKITASKSVVEINSFDFFIDNLCNPQNKNKDNELKKFYERVDREMTNRFQEYTHLFKPWLLLKKKGKIYTRSDELELKKNCEIILSGNYDSDFKKKYLIFTEINDFKYYFKPYFYILEAKNKLKRQYKSFSGEILNNYSIWTGYINWRREIKILWEFFYGSKKDIIEIDEAEIKNVKKKLLTADELLGESFDDEYERSKSYENSDDVDEGY